jgi:hypothetical protein
MKLHETIDALRAVRDPDTNHKGKRAGSSSSSAAVQLLAATYLHSSTCSATATAVIILLMERDLLHCIIFSNCIIVCARGSSW